jgi:hypothetical protein
MLSDPFYNVIFKMVGVIGGRSNVNGNEINLACWKLFSVKVALFIAGLFCIGSVLIIERVAELEATLPPKLRKNIKVFDHAEGAFFHTVKIPIIWKISYSVGFNGFERDLNDPAPWISWGLEAVQDDRGGQRGAWEIGVPMPVPQLDRSIPQFIPPCLSRLRDATNLCVFNTNSSYEKDISAVVYISRWLSGSYSGQGAV